MTDHRRSEAQILYGRIGDSTRAHAATCVSCSTLLRVVEALTSWTHDKALELSIDKGGVDCCSPNVLPLHQDDGRRDEASHAAYEGRILTGDLDYYEDDRHIDACPRCHDLANRVARVVAILHEDEEPADVVCGALLGTSRLTLLQSVDFTRRSPTAPQALDVERVRPDRNVVPTAAAPHRSERLLDEWYAPVMRVCLRMLRDPADAEDATQEVFRRVLQQSAKLRDAPMPWLITIAKHVCTNELRRRRQQELAAATSSQNNLSEVGSSTTPEDMVVERLSFMEGLERLTPAERRAVAAALHGTAVGDGRPATTRVLLARARHKLRLYLEESQTTYGTHTAPTAAPRAKPQPAWASAAVIAASALVRSQALDT